MAKYRRARINDAVAEEMAVALREIRDPRVTDAFVSISRAEVTGDLKIAKIYFSCMGDSREVARALEGASGVFRRHLAETLNLRITPELLFRADNSIEHGAKIAQILSDIAREREEREGKNAKESDETGLRP